MHLHVYAEVHRYHLALQGSGAPIGKLFMEEAWTLENIYACGPLEWSQWLQIDLGSEFKEPCRSFPSTMTSIFAAEKQDAKAPGYQTLAMCIFGH